MSKKALLCLLAALLGTGCATSMSTFHTADGDKARKIAFATLGKQMVEQKTDFEVYPNNSGMSLQDGALSQQDTEAAIPLMRSLLEALIALQKSLPTP